MSSFHSEQGGDLDAEFIDDFLNLLSKFNDVKDKTKQDTLNGTTTDDNTKLDFLGIDPDTLELRINTGRNENDKDEVELKNSLGFGVGDNNVELRQHFNIDLKKSLRNDDDGSDNNSLLSLLSKSIPKFTPQNIPLVASYLFSFESDSLGDDESDRSEKVTEENLLLLLQLIRKLILHNQRLIPAIIDNNILPYICHLLNQYVQFHSQIIEQYQNDIKAQNREEKKRLKLIEQQKPTPKTDKSPSNLLTTFQNTQKIDFGSKEEQSDSLPDTQSGPSPTINLVPPQPLDHTVVEPATIVELTPTQQSKSESKHIAITTLLLREYYDKSAGGSTDGHERGYSLEEMQLKMSILEEIISIVYISIETYSLTGILIKHNLLHPLLAILSPYYLEFDILLENTLNTLILLILDKPRWRERLIKYGLVTQVEEFIGYFVTMKGIQKGNNVVDNFQTVVFVFNLIHSNMTTLELISELINTLCEPVLREVKNDYDDEEEMKKSKKSQKSQKSKKSQKSQKSKKNTTQIAFFDPENDTVENDLESPPTTIKQIPSLPPPPEYIDETAPMWGWMFDLIPTLYHLIQIGFDNSNVLIIAHCIAAVESLTRDGIDGDEETCRRIGDLVQTDILGTVLHCIVQFVYIAGVQDRVGDGRINGDDCGDDRGDDRGDDDVTLFSYESVFFNNNGKQNRFSIQIDQSNVKIWKSQLEHFLADFFQIMNKIISQLIKFPSLYSRLLSKSDQFLMIYEDCFNADSSGVVYRGDSGVGKKDSRTLENHVFDKFDLNNSPKVQSSQHFGHSKQSSQHFDHSKRNSEQSDPGFLIIDFILPVMVILSQYILSNESTDVESRGGEVSMIETFILPVLLGTDRMKKKQIKQPPTNNKIVDENIPNDQIERISGSQNVQNPLMTIFPLLPLANQSLVLDLFETITTQSHPDRVRFLQMIIESGWLVRLFSFFVEKITQNDEQIKKREKTIQYLTIIALLLEIPSTHQDDSSGVNSYADLVMKECDVEGFKKLFYNVDSDVRDLSREIIGTFLTK